jgi:hypothetical protein
MSGESGVRNCHGEILSTSSNVTLILLLLSKIPESDFLTLSSSMPLMIGFKTRTLILRSRRQRVRAAVI